MVKDNLLSLDKNWGFSLRVSLVTVNKSAEACGFVYIYYRNIYWKCSLFVQCVLLLLFSRIRPHTPIKCFNRNKNWVGNVFRHFTGLSFCCQLCHSSHFSLKQALLLDTCKALVILSSCVSPSLYPSVSQYILLLK